MWICVLSVICVCAASLAMEQSISSGVGGGDVLLNGVASSLLPASSVSSSSSVSSFASSSASSAASPPTYSSASSPSPLSTEDDDEPSRVWAKALYIVLYSTISILALGGNGIVIYLIVAYRRMRTVTNVFIANLALGDLLMAVLCIPFTFTANLLLRYWPFGSVMCSLVSYAQAVSVFISAYTMVAISIDRYIAILYPLRPRMTRRQCHTFIALIWFVALLTPLPTALLSRLTVIQLAVEEEKTLTSPQHSPLPSSPPPPPSTPPSPQPQPQPSPSPLQLNYSTFQTLLYSATKLSTRTSGNEAPLYSPHHHSHSHHHNHHHYHQPYHEQHTHVNASPLPHSSYTPLSALYSPALPFLPSTSMPSDLMLRDVAQLHRPDSGGSAAAAAAGAAVLSAHTAPLPSSSTPSALTIYQCTEEWNGSSFRSLYSVLLMALQYGLPFGVLVFTYSRIAFVVWGKQTPGEADGGRDARIAASKRKMVKMMITCVVSFTLCWLPFNTFIVIADNYPWIYDYEHIEYVWFAVHWLAMSHASYNPVIYIWMNQRFRAGFRYVASYFVPCLMTAEQRYHLKHENNLFGNEHQARGTTVAHGYSMTEQAYSVIYQSSKRPNVDTGHKRMSLIYNGKTKVMTPSAHDGNSGHSAGSIRKSHSFTPSGCGLLRTSIPEEGVPFGNTSNRVNGNANGHQLQPTTPNSAHSSDEV